MRRFPHTFVLLLALTALAALATHGIDAGRFEREMHGTQSWVKPGTWHPVEPHPAGIGELFMAWPRGLAATATIVFYIFLIGGTFGVVNATGAIDAAIGAVVQTGAQRGSWVIASLMLLFSFGGATIGVCEETLPFIPALVILARRLGYDELTGCAIALVGAGAGFTGAFLNPFTVGVAQGIAGLPLYSGMGYRALVFVVVTTIAIVYVLLYSRRTRSAADLGANSAVESLSAQTLNARRLAVLGVMLLALAGVVFGAMKLDWGLNEMAALFIATAIAAGLIGGLGANSTAEKFIEGAAGIAGGALVVGLARGVLVIFDGAAVTDTILRSLTGIVQQLPSWMSVTGIYVVQVALSYIVPSGSGQAALSLPILLPLGDMVGVTRQTSVLAFQFGDGFSNILTPTSGYFMAALALAKVPFSRWVRFVVPLQLLWLLAGLALLLIAHAIRWS